MTVQTYLNKTSFKLKCLKNCNMLLLSHYAEQQAGLAGRDVVAENIIFPFPEK